MSEIEIIQRLINEDSEHELLDFKLEVYPITRHHKKHEFLKDMCAFANNISNEIKYIIIGVKKTNGKVKYYNIQEDIDQASYSEYITSSIEPKIHFDYKTIQIDDYTISYFKIYNNNERPYLFKKDINNLEPKNIIVIKTGDGFIRKGTVNYKLSRSDFEDIYKYKYLGSDVRDSIEVTVSKQTGFYKSKSVHIPYTYLDIFIENSSNKSFFIDVIIRIEKSIEYDITDLTNHKEYLRISTGGNLYEHEKNPHFDFIVTTKFYVAEAKSIPSAQGAFYLKKMSTLFPIFGKYLVLEMKQPYVTVTGHIEINSDSFHEGSIIKHFST